MQGEEVHRMGVTVSTLLCAGVSSGQLARPSRHAEATAAAAFC